MTPRCSVAAGNAVEGKIVRRKIETVGKINASLVVFQMLPKKLVNRNSLPIPICLASISACFSESQCSSRSICWRPFNVQAVSFLESLCASCHDGCSCNLQSSLGRSRYSRMVKQTLCVKLRSSSLLRASASLLPTCTSLL